MVFGIDDSVIVGVAGLGLVLLSLVYILRRSRRRHDKVIALAYEKDGAASLSLIKTDKWGIVRHGDGAYPLRPEHTTPLKGPIAYGRLVVLRKDVPAPLLLTPPDPGAKPVLSVKGLFGAVSPGYEYYHNPAYATAVENDGDEGVRLTDEGIPITETDGFLVPDWRSAYELEELIGERKLAEYHTSGEERETSLNWYVTWGLILAILGILAFSIFG